MIGSQVDPSATLSSHVTVPSRLREPPTYHTLRHNSGKETSAGRRRLAHHRGHQAQIVLDPTAPPRIPRRGAVALGNLIPDLNVKENIEVGANISKDPIKVEELLNDLGLWEHKDKFPKQLSGGQQQRCAIGRALVKKPAVLLCDEPTGALDYKTSKEILALIERVNKEYNTTIIIATHNEEITGMAKRIVRLKDGKINADIVNENIKSAEELEW